MILVFTILSRPCNESRFHKLKSVRKKNHKLTSFPFPLLKIHISFFININNFTIKITPYTDTTSTSVTYWRAQQKKANCKCIDTHYLKQTIEITGLYGTY